MLYCFNASEVFRLAIEIKANCIAFYEKAQRMTKDPEVKKLFEDLVQEETGHKARIESVEERLAMAAGTPTVSDPEH